MEKIKYYISLLFFDKNEKNFIKAAKKLIENDNKKKKGTVLISVINDYYYLCYLYCLYKDKLKDYNLIGYWPHLVYTENKSGNKLYKFLKKLSPIYHYFLKKKWFTLYRSLGVKKIVDPDNLDKEFYIKNNENIYLIQKKKILNKIKNKKDILNIYYKKIYVGDLIYDTYLRFRNNPTIDLSDEFLQKIIFKTINFFHVFKKISKKINYFYTPYSSYIVHGLPSRIFVNNNVRVITDGNNQYNKILSKKDIYHVENYRKFRDEFSKLKNKNECRKLAQLYIKDYFFNSKTTSIYNYLKKNPFYQKKRSKFKNLDGVIFLPNFFETQREWGNIIFNDFYEWIFYTVYLIDKYKLKIALKPHPNINTINKESITVIKEIKDKFPNLMWIDPNESNHKIFNSIKFGISSWGSALGACLFQKSSYLYGFSSWSILQLHICSKKYKEIQKLNIKR